MVFCPVALFAIYLSPRLPRNKITGDPILIGSPVILLEKDFEKKTYPMDERFEKANKTTFLKKRERFFSKKRSFLRFYRSEGSDRAQNLFWAPNQKKNLVGFFLSFYKTLGQYLIK